MQYIHQLANILAINYQRIALPGITEGVLGVAMFLYKYSQKYRITSYGHIADDIVGYVVDNHVKKMNRSFALGLYGVGWALKRFEDEKYVELDEKCLDDITKLLNLKYNSYDYIADVSVEEYPLFSMGLYAVACNDFLLFEKVLSNAEFICENIRTNKPNMTFLLSVIYCLKKISLHSKYTNHCDELLTVLINAAELLFDKGEFSAKDAYIIQGLLKGTNLEYKARCIEIDMLEDVYCNWQTIIYADIISVSNPLSNETISNFMNKIKCDIPQSILGLNGLSSFGINLLNTM